MAELILPGVYIEVRPEGLIVPGQITVGNLGVVGTASKGELNESTLVSDAGEARQKFGPYDSFIDPSSGKPRANSLTLVRALEQAFAYGATTVFAVRVADETAAPATHVLTNGADKVVTLTAKTPGTWANDLKVNVSAAEESAFIEDEAVSAAAPNLRFKPVESARNRITHTSAGTGVQTSFSGANIIYTGAVAPGKVKIDPATKALTFDASLGLVNADTLKASYVVDKAESAKVTLRLGTVDEIYTVVDGTDLIADIKDNSSWVVGSAPAGHVPNKLPTLSATPDTFASFPGGKNGEAASQADYEGGLNVLLNEDTHIMVGAGQDDSFGSELDKHCQKASTDVFKRDRIAIVGSKAQSEFKDKDAFFDYLRGHNLSSDRLIFVAPGIKANDSAVTRPGNPEVILPGAYAAAAVAGLLASLSPHVSLTNKVLPVDDLERVFTSPELTQLVQRGIVLLEKRQGFRVVRGITTQPPGSAFAQITTRRIVDYAKYGVRSAAQPYIGLLNNERVRGALKATVNSFLAEMVLDEMLVSYDLAVTATRDDERKGIARVTMVLRPTFSIDFIKVTMFLE